MGYRLQKLHDGDQTRRLKLWQGIPDNRHLGLPLPCVFIWLLLAGHA
jgi:hypothetical protein